MWNIAFAVDLPALYAHWLSAVRSFIMGVSLMVMIVVRILYIALMSVAEKKFLSSFCFRFVYGGEDARYPCLRVKVLMLYVNSFRSMGVGQFLHVLNISGAMWSVQMARGFCWCCMARFISQ